MKNYFLLAAAVMALGLAACQPQSTGQKVENKMEDAGHEVGQAAENAGENVKDAAN